MLDSSNVIVRLLVAVLVYYLFDVVINTFVADANANKIFKIILILICLAIVFVGGFIHF